MTSMIEVTLAMGGLLTAFLVAYRIMNAFEPEVAVQTSTVRYPGCKRVA